jgi:hypothetical protein
MGEASKGLLQLRPITFREKANDANSKGRELGLLAEEVAKINTAWS